MDDMIFTVTSNNTVAAKAQLKLFLFLHENGIDKNISQNRLTLENLVMQIKQELQIKNSLCLSDCSSDLFNQEEVTTDHRVRLSIKLLGS